MRAFVITLSSSEIGVDDIADVSFDDIPHLMLKHRRDEVIDAYCSVFGFSKDELLKWEGGIDSWIGFGSVTCFELGGGTLVGYGHNEVQMAILEVNG